MRHGLGWILCLAVASVAVVLPAHAGGDPVGDWIGELKGGFRVRIHIAHTKNGYSATLTNPSGNVTELEAVRCDGAHLHFEVASLDLGYDADWDEAHQEWHGVLRFQGENAMDLRRATAAEMAPLVHRRPQEAAIAAGPRPYRDVEVHFDDRRGAARVRLGGTLSVPDGKGPFPAVVLVSGTGRNTRDETVWDHRIFLVLADAFARRGIAVMRYDKRGVGDSNGDYDAATTADFADDAEAGVEFIKSRPEIDARRIGMLGHSEGGIIVPMVAARDSDVRFIILMAGPGLRGDRLFVEQSALTARVYGAPDDYIARRREVDEALYEAVVAAPSQAEARTRAQAIIDKAVADHVVDHAEARTLAQDVSRPWERFFLAYDPAPVVSRVGVPILALNGSLDVQVPAKSDLAAIRAAVVRNPDATVRELPGLNHLFQRAKTGGPNEYNDIEETVDPDALNLIVEWAVAHVR